MNNKQIKFLESESNLLVKKLKNNSLKKYKKILIVGSSGLIGLNLVFNLILLKNKYNYNYELTLITKNKINKSLLNYYKKNKIKFIKKDITDKKFSLNLMYDLIFFSAGYASPKIFVKKNKETLLVHSLGLMNISKYLIKKGLLIYFSSSEIYNGLNKNFVENRSGNTNFDDIRAPYINGKKFGETYCHILNQMGYNIKILRISLTYGPGASLNDNRVLNEMIINGLKTKKIQLLDQGKSVRKYLYINDCIELIFNISKKSNKIIYNISGNSKLTIRDLAKIICKKTNSKLSFKKNNTAIKGAPNIVNVNNDRICKEFKKLEYINILNGIDKTIKWYNLKI